jgi:hypothetical protein
LHLYANHLLVFTFWPWGSGQVIPLTRPYTYVMLQVMICAQADYKPQSNCTNVLWIKPCPDLPKSYIKLTIFLQNCGNFPEYRILWHILLIKISDNCSLFIL